MDLDLLFDLLDPNLEFCCFFFFFVYFDVVVNDV